MSLRKPTREGSHANARITPRIRREIQMAPLSVSNAALARRYGIHRHTVAKWRKRVSTEGLGPSPSLVHHADRAPGAGGGGHP